VEQPLILDRYRPLADLASGGFGEVVLAYDTRMQRRVAIKRLPVAGRNTHRAASPTGLAEARTAALLNHPNIVTVHEWDTDADEAFLIMEYIDGPSLAEVLDAGGALDLDQTAAIVADVASAIAYAHDNGVLHLDIKPENVLLTRDGRAKVTDFGIAALSGATGHGPAAGGTLGYMPLEQLRDLEVDERTDVWALAALTFELLTDANPFSSASIEGAVFKVDVMDLPVPSEYADGLPAPIDDVLTAALAPHQAERYHSVAAFASALLPQLGDAGYGRETLLDLIESDFALESDDVGRADWDNVGLWDRAPLAGAVVGRLMGAVVGGWLAFAGLAAVGLDRNPALGAAALTALAGALAPGLGSLLGLVLFLGAVAMAGWWPMALVLGITGVAVWWFAGRRDAGFAAALLGPALGMPRISLATPMLLGFWLTPLRAAALCAYSATITLLVSAVSGGRAPYIAVDWRFFLDPLGSRVIAGSVRTLLSEPSPIIVVATWALAGALMSLACSRGSRLSAFVGAGLAGVALWGGYTLAELTSRAVNGSMTWTGQGLLPYLTASLILVVLVAAAGAPPRAEEE